MVRDVDSFSRFCLFTTDEYIDTSREYGVTFEDPYRLLFNFIYRFGRVYDSASTTYYMWDGVPLDEYISLPDAKIFGAAVG
jgi:hypothetical protein